MHFVATSTTPFLSVITLSPLYVKVIALCQACLYRLANQKLYDMLINFTKNLICLMGSYIVDFTKFDFLNIPNKGGGGCVVRVLALLSNVC